MSGARAECGGLAEAVVFLRFFEELPDPRQRAKVIYPLDEILLLCLLAVLAGAETVTDMARFGEKKRAFLRRFRPFADGTPTHDHLGRHLTKGRYHDRTVYGGVPCRIYAAKSAGLCPL